MKNRLGQYEQGCPNVLITQGGGISKISAFPPLPLFLPFHRMAQGEHPLERLGLRSPKKPLNGGMDISICGDKGLQVCITVSKTQGL